MIHSRTKKLLKHILPQLQKITIKLLLAGLFEVQGLLYGIGNYVMSFVRQMY